MHQNQYTSKLWEYMSVSRKICVYEYRNRGSVHIQRRKFDSDASELEASLNGYVKKNFAGFSSGLVVCDSAQKP